ncbi:DUF1629 domain-containing protein [Stenotrophomonas oahuensis]|uniref:DUF1629 domain-containing protein n=1 Tax=Stenotrophomonas oahuensis TaxID=3003271 RepID=A0ABY9YPB1_9GAMM|nr:DUF1629 domain-containing protein [Stenotrophomonas sp. A5586]WNH52742.1 DUF1629 domain-containing protein [Stenotrophomonas sp. A5586]
MSDHKLQAGQPGEYYLLRPDVTRGGKGLGVEFVNEDRLRTPPRLILRPEGGGFPPMHETPILQYVPKLGHAPEDMEDGMSGYWLVSDRLKQVFQSVDPSGFEFVECEYRLPDGSEGPRYHLCDVVRTLDALDESASRLTVEHSDEFPEGKFYNLLGGASLRFRKDVVDDSHVFILPYSGDLVICDRALRDAVIAAGMGVEGRSRGVWLTDAADI